MCGACLANLNLMIVQTGNTEGVGMRRLIVTVTWLFCLPALAADVVAVKQLDVDLANEIAREAMHVCRGRGYQVSAVVVDRAANVQVMIRDNLASRFTTIIARRKANAVILSGVDSASFRKNRMDIREEMNHVDGSLVLEGGVPIRAGGVTVGALGVSGAPGGDKDAECATKALSKYQERLEFAD